MTSKLIKLVVASLMLFSVPSCNKEEKETEREKSKRIMKEEFDASQKAFDEAIEKEESDRLKSLEK